jgi:hypothetical protein
VAEEQLQRAERQLRGSGSQPARLVAVRDSEKPDGAKLVISREIWQVFLKGLRPQLRSSRRL